jgi:hypothetical protein
VGTATATTPIPYTPPLESLSNEKTVSTTTWSAALLAILKAPITPNNIANVQTWLHNEQSSSTWSADATNPLGVETNGKVESQGNVLQGLLLTAGTITNDHPTILAALKNDSPRLLFAQALVTSGWNTTAPKNGQPTYNNNTAAEIAANGPLVTGTTTNLTLAQEAEQGEAGAVVTPVVEGATSIAGLIGDITNPSTLRNVGVFVAGFVLAGVGLLVFFSQTKEARTAESLAAKAA